MSRYDWPEVKGTKVEHDDPGGRAGFLSRRRTDFDPDGARQAGRTVPMLHGSPHGPFAPPSGRQHLWQPLGPMTVIKGQATGAPRVAGRVNALAVDTTGTRIYAASGNGGIWYSSDAGAHWRSLGGFAPTNTPEVNRPAQRNSCGAIRVMFGATEADDDVFIGTGEAASQRVSLPRNAQPGISLGGIGILFAHGPAIAAANANPWRREAKNLIGYGVNRIAIGPDGTTVIAATSTGLFQRPNAPSADVDWVRVAGAPFSTLTDECTDVLWTAGAGARPARLWVWVRNGDKAGLWVRSGTSTDFKPVATPGSANRNAVLAASNPPDQIFLFNDRGSSTLPALFRIAAATAADPAVITVAGVPDVLQGQGFYDIALAVHPSQPNHVVLGGCTFSATTPDGTAVSDGAVVMGDVALVGGVLTLNNPRMISLGVHSDVHDVVYSNAGNRIWTSCDGGVYRSDNPTRLAGFFPCNDGLAIIESNYIANHPIGEGYIVTGLQDNGVIERLLNGVWRLVEGGDGGSVVFDPVRPVRFMSQYVQGVWRASDGTFKWNSPNNLLNRAGTLASAENNASAFYSTAAGTKQTRGVNVVGQIIAGSTRVWYTENFGAPWPTATDPRWVTLPTGTDPLPGNPSQDDFGEKITVCRWQSPDVAWILGEGKLMRYARTPGSDAAGGPGTWVKPAEMIIKKNIKNKKDATSADGPIRDSSVWTDIAVNLDPPVGAGQPPQQHGTKGALYLGTIGNADNDDVDTLWWFDGTSKWFKTMLRKDENGHPRVPAPVTAIVCDPAFPNEVYVGTTVGVWKGVRTQVGNADPTWTWEARVNGLPEAAVEDLAIFSDGGLRLLRAAIAARGVWELRLDVADVVDLTYVRAHNDDLRYRARAIDKQRDLVTARSWHGSPDVRPRLAPQSRPAPSSLPWTQTTAGIDPELLRRFQAAMRSRTGDPRVRATGLWDGYFNEVLRDLGAPLILPNIVGINKAFWELSMNAPNAATAEPWGTAIPTEADLAEYAASLTEGDLVNTSCSLPPRPAKVDIAVHRRGLDAMDGANVRVTLLKWIDPKTKNKAKWNDRTTWFSGNVPWTGAVNDVLNSAAGTTAQTFAAGWSFVGTTNATRRRTLTGQTLDPTHSGIATFDLNLSGLKNNTVVLLVAVIRAGTSPADNLALTAATLEDLAMTSPNVAVRSVRIIT
jgi:hypothetical protein